MNKRAVMAIVISTLWISGFEFLRNEILLKDVWVSHYNSLGLGFPSEPINGLVWGLWSLLLAIMISVLARKQTLSETVLIAWIFAFVMMWVVIGNLSVLPTNLLLFAVPLSLIEVYVAARLTFRFKPQKVKDFNIRTS